MANTDNTETISADEAEIMEFLIRESGNAPEPGTLSAGDVVNKSSNEDAPFPMVAREVTSAGYVTIYDRVTGDPSIVNRNMLPNVLKKKNPETGSLVFTLRDPGFRPKQGTYKCDLHKESPLREKFDELGVPTCRKSNLKTEWDKMRHMQRRHSQESAAFKEDEYRAEREEEKAFKAEDRAFQKKLLESLISKGLIE